MTTFGLDLSDVSLRLASGNGAPAARVPAESSAPGFAYYDGRQFIFGLPAEDQWFAHPRRVTHSFWERLSHEASSLGPVGKPVPYSELGFRWFQEFVRAQPELRHAGKVGFAVPPHFVGQSEAQETKIGLVLGLAAEINLPLSTVVDSGCAALRIMRSGPVPPECAVVVDLHLESATVGVYHCADKVERHSLRQMNDFGYAAVLKHLTGSMANRFLRHTAFDVLEDGAQHQTFFRQTKTFVQSNAAEFRYRILTPRHGYELAASRTKLVADVGHWTRALVQAVEAQRAVCGTTEPEVVLTASAQHMPGLEDALRAANLGEVRVLPPLAAAIGAARLAHVRALRDDVSDVPVELSVSQSIHQ